MFAFKKNIVLCTLTIVLSFILCINTFGETSLNIVTSHFPPFINEDSKRGGFLIEILDEVAREMNVNFVFKFMPWKRCESSVERLEAWGSIPYVPTPEREKKFYFSDKLYIKHTKFFYYSPDGKNKNLYYNNLGDLKNYKIGGIKGYYYVKTLHNAGLDTELVYNEKQNFQKLKAGRTDLVLAVETLGWYIIRKTFPSEAGNFFTIEKPFHEGGNYLMTSKNYPNTLILLERFNTALKTIKENGTYQKILDKHGIIISY
jgi:polar amino acid transport system substrate-binding protein